MARLSEKWILDLEVSPTSVGQVTAAQVEEALYALQVKGVEGAELQDVLSTLAVALVKHLKHQGHYRAVILDESPLIDTQVE